MRDSGPSTSFPRLVALAVRRRHGFSLQQAAGLLDPSQVRSKIEFAAVEIGRAAEESGWPERYRSSATARPQQVGQVETDQLVLARPKAATRPAEKGAVSNPFAVGTKSSASRSTALTRLMDGIAQHWRAAVRPHPLDSAMTNAPRGVHPSIGAEGPLISAPRLIRPYCAAGASSAVPRFLIIDPVSALSAGA